MRRRARAARSGELALETLHSLGEYILRFNASGKKARDSGCNAVAYRLLHCVGPGSDARAASARRLA